MEFYLWQKANNDRMLKMDPLALCLHIKGRWSDPELRKEYLSWSSRWRRRRRAKTDQETTPMEFKQEIAGITFGNAKSRGKWLWRMTMCTKPFCILGESKFGGML